ncbi:MAG: hypothetical protein HQL95_10620 [Magnetococcales bacterium]|nr:hypothetical protein [Magnetococcales bacterium]
MNTRKRFPGGQSGGMLMTVVVIFALLGLGMNLVTRIGPAIYEYYLLRDLADRVVREYAKLPSDEVKRRVNYELNRSRLPEGAISLVRTTSGYRVSVEREIPLSLTLGETVLALPGHEVWTLTYQVES